MAGASDVKAGGAFVEVFVKGLKPAQQQLTSLGAGLTKWGVGIAAVGSAIAAPLVAAVGHFVEAGGAIDDVANRTGMARTELAQLQYVGHQVGATLEDIERAMLTAGRKGVSGTFDEIAARIAQIQDPAERIQAAFEAWGKSGAKLLPLVDNLQAMKAEARSLGIGVSDQDIRNADELGDLIAKIQSQFSATTSAVGAALAPALIQVAGLVSSLITPVTTWLNQNRQVVVTVAAIAAGLVALGTLVATVGGGFAAIGLAIGGISAALPVLAAIGPPLLIGTAAAAGLALQLYLVYRAMQQLGISVGQLVSGLVNLLRTINPLFAILERLAGPTLRGMVLGISAASTALVSQAQAAFNAASGWRDYAASIDEANEALDLHAQISKSLESALNRRKRLVDEFATAEERAAAKEREIVEAINQVNRNRVLGFLTDEEAAAETKALQTALARHRASEAERRKQRADAQLPGAGAAALLVPPVAGGERRSSVAQSAAAAVALSFGGAGGQLGWRDVVAELRELRRQSVRQHEEAVREMRRGGGVRIGP